MGEKTNSFTVPYGRLWRWVYGGRSVMLLTLAGVCVLIGVPLGAVYAVGVVIPFNLATAEFHRRTGRAAQILPFDQILAASALLISPRLLPAVIICMIFSAITGCLGRPAREALGMLAAVVPILATAAWVHQSWEVIGFGVPAIAATGAAIRVVDSLLRRNFGADSRTADLLEGLHAAIYEADLSNGRVTFCNDRALEIFGGLPVGTDDLASIVHPDDREWFGWAITAAALEESATSLEARFFDKGDYLWMEARVSFSRRDNVRRIRMLVFDISSRKKVEQELAHRSLHDPLTQLPNRMLLMERLESALERTTGFSEPTAVLLLDMDQFKPVNDGLGHHAGDKLLIEVGRRISLAVGEADTVARLGGDEFAIVLTDTTSEEAEYAAQKIAKAVAQEFFIHETRILPSVSIGIAVATERRFVSGSSVLQHADTAMYRAKRAGLGIAVYEPSLDQVAELLIHDVSELHQAFELDELRAYYQPLVDSVTGRVSGCEALVRWQHPTRGLLTPADFVPTIMSSGMSPMLSRWMLERAISQASRWRHQGHRLTVAVNLAVTDLLNVDLISWLISELGRTQLPPSLLTIEITEAELLLETTRTREVLESLRSFGVEIAVDDFGTGYSSLVWLRELPITSLKIDRSFIESMTTDDRSRAIVQSTIGLAKSLSLKTVGEGVEDAETQAALSGLGCTHMQGFHFSRPLTSAAFDDLVNDPAKVGGFRNSAGLPGHGKAS
jgi:diguanylate cyclase (GGDEF)-like protein/PAS domain S-box-containing protein